MFSPEFAIAIYSLRADLWTMGGDAFWKIGLIHFSRWAYARAVENKEQAANVLDALAMEQPDDEEDE